MSQSSQLEVIRRPARQARGLPPLLFVHGAYAAAWCWDEYFLPFFSDRGYDCHAVSLRGHGRSAGIGDLDRFGIDDYVADVHAVARTLRVPPVVIGHSMGGAVAQQYAGAHAASGLVLMASVPPQGLVGMAIELWWRDPDLLFQFALVQSGHGYLANVHRLRSALFAPDMPLDRAMRYFARMQRESQRALTELSHRPQFPPRTLRAVPVAILGGREDGLFLPHAVERTAAWHEREAAILPGLGHTMMLDCDWRRAAEHIASWLATALGEAPTRAWRRRAARRAEKKTAQLH